MGNRVEITINEEEEKQFLKIINPIKKEEDVFLIDHAWTFKYRDCEKTLRENVKLR